MGMYKLQGQPPSDTNWFAHDWHNHVPTASGFALELVAKKFWQASSCPQMVGLSDLASPSPGAVGTFPYMLTFRPQLSVNCPGGDYELCLKNLQTIPAGKT